jgi:hypothetical protein
MRHKKSSHSFRELYIAIFWSKTREKANNTSLFHHFYLSSRGMIFCPNINLQKQKQKERTRSIQAFETRSLFSNDRCCTHICHLARKQVAAPIKNQSAKNKRKKKNHQTRYTRKSRTLAKLTPPWQKLRPPVNGYME